MLEIESNSISRTPNSVKAKLQHKHFSESDSQYKYLPPITSFRHHMVKIYLSSSHSLLGINSINMSHYKQSNIHIAAILLLALASGLCYTTEKVTYSGYALFRAFPQIEQHVANLRRLRAQEYDGIEFWTEPVAVNRTVDIMVSPEQLDYFSDILKHARLPAKRIMHDVGEVIKRTNNIQTRVGRMFELESGEGGTNVSASYYSTDNYYLRYQSYSFIEKKLQLLAENPIVTLDVIGYSYERRKLYLVKVSTDSKAQKPVIFLDAGHHAREWISHSTLLYVMESLIVDQMPTIRRQNYEPDYLKAGNCSADAPTIEHSSARRSGRSSSSEKLKSLLDQYDFWFLPVVNPDGYEYSHRVDRLWRKTRSMNNDWNCAGVDPNRNYPFAWGGAGTSKYPCSETYAGPKALSEPETQTLASTIMQHRNRIVMYVSLHAYSQVILMPYGNEPILPKYYEEMRQVGLAGSRAIYTLRGTRYKVGTSAILLYAAAGGSDDFAYENGGVKYSYTIELPDTGNKGFLLPPSEIIPVGQETVAGLFAMVKEMSPPTR